MIGRPTTSMDAPLADGGARGSHAALVGMPCARHPDAWDDQEGCRAKVAAQHGRLLGRAHQPRNPAAGRHLSQAEHLRRGRLGYADPVEFLGIHAGKDGDRQQARAPRHHGGGLRYSQEHGLAPRRVDSQQGGSRAGDRTDRSRDGVGDVMQLEVQKDRKAPPAKGLDQAGPSRAEELEAHLHPAARAFQTIGEVERLPGGGEVERYRQPVFRLQKHTLRLRPGSG